MLKARDNEKHDDKLILKIYGINHIKLPLPRSRKKKEEEKKFDFVMTINIKSEGRKNKLTN